MILGKLVLDCEHGPDRKKHVKAKANAKQVL